MGVHAKLELIKKQMNLRTLRKWQWWEVVWCFLQWAEWGPKQCRHESSDRYSVFGGHGAHFTRQRELWGSVQGSWTTGGTYLKHWLYSFKMYCFGYHENRDVSWINPNSASRLCEISKLFVQSQYSRLNKSARKG